MSRLALRSLPTLAALAIAGCAHPSPAPTPTSQPGAPPASSPASPPAQASLVQPIGAPAARVVERPGPPGDGEAREVRVLVDEPALKLVSIVLRRGTVLPEHHSEVPVTILALRGSGTVLAGSERLRIDATHTAVLAPKVPHAVEPDPGTDLTLLVYHLGRGAEHQH